MYTAFYGLGEKPFSLTPDPRYLYLSASHREALAHLLYGIEQGEGFIAITGEVGTGKTTICRTLIERLGAETEVAFLFNPSRSARELLEAVASEFGLPAKRRSRSDLHDDLNRFLLEKKRESKRVLLIIDESQNLSAETLEQVRLLSNLETATSKLIQILLLGQPELDRKLDSQALRQLRQRISVRWRLSPLSQRETGEYIAHRLRVAAGAPRAIFGRSALREIYRQTRGVPRLINVLCDRALLYGYAAQSHRVSSKQVREVAKEIPDASITKRARSRTAPRAASRFLGTAAVLVVASAAGGLVAYTLFGERFAWLPPILGLSEPGLEVPQVSSAPPPSVAVEPIPLTEPFALTPSISLLTAREPEPSMALLEEEAEPLSSPVQTSARLAAVAPVAVIAPPESARVALVTAVPASEQTPEPAREPSFLGWTLAKRDPDATRSDALDSILDAYGLAPSGAPVTSLAGALSHLRARGLRVLTLPSTNLDSLRTLNHPVLLILRADDGRPRVVALRALDASLASITGPVDSKELVVHASEMETLWTGRAYVLWRQFEPAPEVITPGEQGLPVLWLQRALSELGYFSHEPSGLYGAETVNGVRTLQERVKLEPDGAAGPRTQMVLYDLLGRYPLPRLSERGPSG